MELDQTFAVAFILGSMLSLLFMGILKSFQAPAKPPTLQAHKRLSALEKEIEETEAKLAFYERFVAQLNKTSNGRIRTLSDVQKALSEKNGIIRQLHDRLQGIALLASPDSTLTLEKETVGGPDKYEVIQKMSLLPIAPTAPVLDPEFAKLQEEALKAFSPDLKGPDITFDADDEACIN